jgi:4-amino-4-deoxy-L-arabinose transferase-like glycosyltransferase
LQSLYQIIRDRAGRIVDALADPVRGNTAAAAAIGFYILVWWLYAVVSKSAEDIHFDMAELVAWSLEPAFGYPKHPPFSAWVVTVWFALFPYRDWAYYLLTACNGGVALWFVWLIAQRYVAGEKRALALTLLMFSVAFNFHLLRFNLNTLLVSTWAVATYLFLRSYTERSLWWGLLAGIAAAIAMLTKYWSILLLFAFVIGVLFDSRRAAYFRSPAPWASVAAGALLLAPNIVSLIDYGFQSVKYGVSVHAVAGSSALFNSLLNYAGGIFYLAGTALVFVLACRPGRAALAAIARPREPDLRLMGIVLLATVLTPIPVSFALDVRLDSLWTLPFWATVPALLLAPPQVRVTRDAAAAVIAAAVCVPLVALLLSPLVALTIHRAGIPNSGVYYAQLSAETDRYWNAQASGPLRYVAGPDSLAWGCTFYCRDHPRAFPNFSRVIAPWIDPAAMARDGWVGLCRQGDQLCLTRTRTLAASPARGSVTLTRTLFGIAAKPEAFVILVVPPASQPRPVSLAARGNALIAKRGGTITMESLVALVCPR